MGFVHCEDHYWNQGGPTGGGMAYKSVSLGKEERLLQVSMSTKSVMRLFIFIAFKTNFQFAARTMV